MNNKSIKWGCIQPLTGGMYLGAEAAIGHPAEWIITYPGLSDLVKDKTGEVVDAGNEANLIQYLTKHNRMPDYFIMNRTMTQNDEVITPKYTLNGEDATPDLTNMDLVVAVPVCAGLTMGSNPVTRAARKEENNCQMVWMTKYVLKGIKPKVYLFENAPTLMSDRGDEVRDQLETVAKEAGYSCIYYKTDTKFHHNCQKRPRTFIYFFKHKNGKPFIPQFMYERDTLSVEEFFNELPKLRENDPMNVTLDNIVNVEIPLDYMVERFGKDWREHINGDLTILMAKNEKEKIMFLDWLLESEYDSKYLTWYSRYFKHIDEKLSQNKGWWSTTAKYFNNHLMPACMYKNVPITVHHSEDRLYTMREWLFAMGHPIDFDMIGKPWNYFRKIGQNVPARTAQWIVSEAVRILKNWNEEETLDYEQNVAFFDNSKQKKIW